MRHILTNGNPVNIPIRYSNRAKYVRISWSKRILKFELVIPQNGCIDQAINFLLSKETEIRNHIIKASTETKTIKMIRTVMLNDVSYSIKYINSSSPDIIFDIKNSTIEVYGNSSMYNILLRCWLTGQAKLYLTKRVKVLAQKHNVIYKKITVKDTVSQWGSCSNRGNISLNWRLHMVPIPVSNYVIIHEFAHRKYMNHSASFWKEVGSMCPHYYVHMLWLKKHGSYIQQEIFQD